MTEQPPSAQADNGQELRMQRRLIQMLTLQRNQAFDALAAVEAELLDTRELLAAARARIIEFDATAASAEKEAARSL